jgi:predicted DNA-binding protein
MGRSIRTTVSIHSSTNGNRERFDFWIDSNDMRRLRQVSKQTGAPVAHMVREAVSQYLPKVDSKLADNT